MTLVEFLHPIRTATQKDVVLATMEYLHAHGQSEVTSADIKQAMKDSRYTRGKNWNVPAVLGSATPNVTTNGKRNGMLVWSLTTTGHKYVQETLGMTMPPAASAPAMAASQDISTLANLVAGLTDEAVRGYVDEALICLTAGAHRAAVVFLWTGVVATLRDRAWASGIATIDAHLKTHNPKASFKKKDDFAAVKDVALLQLCQDLGLIDKTEKQRLQEGLDLRNCCGHPTKYKAGEKKVSAFIEDMVGIVWQ